MEYQQRIGNDNSKPIFSGLLMARNDSLKIATEVRPLSRKQEQEILEEVIRLGDKGITLSKEDIEKIIKEKFDEA